MTWDFDSSTAENSRRELPALAAEYFAAGRAAMDKKRSHRELHRFRVKTKRFRYTLEMFRSAYGPGLDTQLDRLRQLQGILGKISDAYTIRELLRDDGCYKKDLDREGKKRVQEFRQHWETVFDAAGEEEAWISTLKSSA